MSVGGRGLGAALCAGARRAWADKTLAYKIKNAACRQARRGWVHLPLTGDAVDVYTEDNTRVALQSLEVRGLLAMSPRRQRAVMVLALDG